MGTNPGALPSVEGAMRSAFVVFFALAFACSPPHGERTARGSGVGGSGGEHELPSEVDAGTTSALDTVPRVESAHTIPDEATWRSLCARPASSATARTEVVKFLVDLHDERRIWFIDTERWDIHYFFARDRLSRFGDVVEDHGNFNIREYRHDDRRFEMGSIVHYLDSDLWAMELISGDTLSGERIVTLLEQIRDAGYFGEHLRFRPISPIHEAHVAEVPGRLPLVTADEVFAGIDYQPLTIGTAFGTLRIVRGPLDIATVRPDEILVLAELPDEIPVVSGVLSVELEAPLGHIAILCATRGTPNMALRTALDETSITSLEGSLVALTVGAQEWSIRPASRDEAEASWAAMRPETPLVPVLDREEDRLRQVCDVRLADVPSVGAKAAQLGETCALRGVIRTPGGFTIPMRHYLEHVERTDIDASITALLGDTAVRDDGALRDARLAEIRAAIEAAPFDPTLLRNVRRRMRETDDDSRWIFRSSTNAEDLPGFTGAGLYRSIVVSATATDDEIAAAIREVWASVWLLGAYEERDWYRVEQSLVAMAILAQPFVDGAAVNMVAITANPFYEGRPGYFINAQTLGGSVTGAGGDEVPEQHLVYTYTEVIETELLSRSSRVEGLLLTEADLLRIAEVLGRLHRHFVGDFGDPGLWPTRGDSANAVDVELLLAGDDRHVVVLQARPYHVVYTEGREWD